MKRQTLPTAKRRHWPGNIDAQREADAAYAKLRSKRRAKRRRTRLETPSVDSQSSMKPGCVAFLEWIQQRSMECERNGIAVQYRVVTQPKRRSTLHVIFRDAEGRVSVHWWPGNGKAIVGDIQSGKRHFAATADAAMNLATVALSTIHQP